MNSTVDEPAPWTLAQRISLLMFPIFLFGGVSGIAGAFAAPGKGAHEAPLPVIAEALAHGSQSAAWLVGGVIAFAVACFVAVMLVGSGSECPDERDRLIELEALRRFFWFVLVGVMPLLALSGALLPPRFLNGGMVAFGLISLALAIYFGSLLQLYHRAARD